MSELERAGWERRRTSVDAGLRGELRRCIFHYDTAGTRCLLDVATVRQAVEILRTDAVREFNISPDAVAIQAIAFDKTEKTNWKVTWHQDLMFPLAKPATASGYDLPTTKDSVAYARPPRTILEELLAVRLHLDECDANNGPLRVSPGTHRLGVLRSSEIQAAVTQHGEAECLACEGEAIFLRPLLLHASSTANRPAHRRVLHVVFHLGKPPSEAWYRAI